jgi:hypothetical protein
MPADGRSSKSASRARAPRATKDVRVRHQQNSRAVDRLAKSLEAAQKDLSALGGTMSSGADDLRKDLSKLLRDARRDVGKLGNAVKRDLQRIQKDLTSAAPKPAPRSRAATKKTMPAKRATSRSTRRPSGRSAAK